MDAGPSGPSGIAPDLAAILDGQVKMQQELADLKKRSVEEMEALKQENSRLKKRIEADANLKGKAKETSEAVKSPAFQPTEEESEYNPTPHTFTTTQQTPPYLHTSPSLSIRSPRAHSTLNHPRSPQHTPRSPHHIHSTLQPTVSSHNPHPSS